jgi:hypothetical protein
VRIRFVAFPQPGGGELAVAKDEVAGEGGAEDQGGVAQVLDGRRDWGFSVEGVFGVAV